MLALPLLLGLSLLLGAAPGKDVPNQSIDAPQPAGMVVPHTGLEQAIAAIAKGFCIDMRECYSTKPLTGRYADKIREYIDPAFLKEHGLEEGPLPIMTTPFRKLDDIRVSDDLQTVLCVVENENARKDVILLRVAIKPFNDRYSYASIRPGSGPDVQSGKFVPWVLKAEISDRPARYALPVPGE